MYSVNWNSVGKILKQRRKEKGLTQTELARRAGTTRQTISKLEKGKAPLVSLNIFARVLSALELEMELKPAKPRTGRLWTPEELLED